MGTRSPGLPRRVEDWCFAPSQAVCAQRVQGGPKAACSHSPGTITGNANKAFPLPEAQYPVSLFASHLHSPLFLLIKLVLYFFWWIQMLGSV